MTWPVIEKTWRQSTQTITALGSTTASARAAMRAVKDAILGFLDDDGNPIWACRYSCDSVTAGTAGDGVDRWDADTDLVWSLTGTLRAWFVFVNQLTGVEFLISLGTNSNHDTLQHFRVSYSAGFTGGSNTTAPTATDQFSILPSDSEWCCFTSNTSNFNQAFNAFCSSDGECLRVFWCASGAVANWWLIEKPAVSIDEAEWDAPIVATVLSQDSDLAAVTTSGSLFGYHASTALTGAMLNGYSNSTAFPARTGTNGFETAYEVERLPFYFSTTNGRGVQGVLKDIWLTSAASTITTGDTAESPSGDMFACFGDLWQPVTGAITVSP